MADTIKYYDSANAANGVYYTQSAGGTYMYNDKYGRTIDGLTSSQVPAGVLSQPNVAATPTATPAPLENDYIDQTGTVHNAAGGNTVQTAPNTYTSVGTKSSILNTPTRTLVTSPTSGEQPTSYATPQEAYTATGPQIPQDTSISTPHKGKNPNVTTFEQDAAAAAQRDANQPNQSQQQTSQAAPVMPWAPGHTGAEVKSLQDFLVSKGFMTAAEVATGPGVFGPKTQAALSKYQMASGGPAASTPAPTASTGQSTYKNEPATPTKPAKSAVQSVIDDYTTAYQSLGLGSIKSQYEDFVKEETDLATKKSDEAQKIKNNPWLTQGIKDKTLEQLDNKYADREKILTNKISLLDSLYKQGQIEVNNIVSKAEAIDAATEKAAAELAQKQIDAANALILAKAKESPSDKYGTGAIGEYNFAKENGYTGSFTQYQNEDANRKAKAAGSGAAVPKTLEERNQVALSTYKQVITSGKKLPDGTPILDSNGKITPVAWNALIDDYSGSRDSFINQFGSRIYTETAKDGTVTVPSSYGLSASEKKLITT